MTKKRLSQRAMLVNLQIAGWSGRVKDQDISDEVMKTKQANTDCGDWWTYLVPKGVLKALQKARMECRNTHYRLTLPWQDGGCRILPAAMFIEYTKAMREAKAGYDKVVKEFLEEYPTFVANAKGRLGHLLDNKRLPNIATIKGKFNCHQNIFPLPDITDFRVDMAEEDIVAVRKQVEESINATTEKAMASIWEKLGDLINKIEITLKQPKKIFRDTLISNLSDFCQLLPKLNLTEDNKLEAVRKETVEKLAELRPDNLRDSKTERKAAVKAAKEVLEKMKSYASV